MGTGGLVVTGAVAVTGFAVGAGLPCPCPVATGRAVASTAGAVLAVVAAEAVAVTALRRRSGAGSADHARHAGAREDGRADDRRGARRRRRVGQELHDADDAEDPPRSAAAATAKTAPLDDLGMDADVTNGADVSPAAGNGVRSCATDGSGVPGPGRGLP